jgi:methyl-accepting chemotaxis protein
MLRWFIMLSTLHTILFYISFLIALDNDTFLTLIRLALMISIPVILIFFLIFFLLDRKYRRILQNRKNMGESDEKFSNMFPVYGNIVISAGGIMITLMTVIVAYKMGLLLSLFQAGYFLIIGGFLAVIIGGFFFYHTKKVLFPLVDYIKFTPITMSQKLLIPVLSSILIILIMTSLGLYRSTYNRINSQYTNEMRANVEKNALFINSIFKESLAEIRGYSQGYEIQSMDKRKFLPFLQRAHGVKNDMIEMLFVATIDGMGYNSFGTNDFIGDRAHFQVPVKTGKIYFSDPILNKRTKNQIMTCSAPVIRDGQIVGMSGATILIATIDKVLNDSVFTKTGRFGIINNQGKVVFHKNKDLIGKVVGESPELTSNGKNITDIEKLKTAQEGKLFHYFYNGVKVISLKQHIPILDYSLFYCVDQIDFVSMLNPLIIQMTSLLVLLALFTYIMMTIIASKFSKPIHDTIYVIRKLSEGDLTVDLKNELHDEFGMLLKSFYKFREVLKETIHQALESAIQLSGSAEELAATSQTLSESTQARAASVEEATAAIEEVSSSIESINNNAARQSDLASVTFRSMEDLKKDIATVLDYAIKAQETAKNTTNQAQTGNRLMQDTISGMNNIDTSTKKIADMVRLISDISDQVNLLALNASIEAARAGEHGRGFAVVAEEISKLADETAATAKSITELVKTGLSEVNRGREFLDSTSKAFENIISNIEQTETHVKNITDSSKKQFGSSEKVLSDTRSVLEMAESISTATNEQMITNQEMAKTIDQINQVTQTEAGGSEEIASSAEEISAQAVNLKSRMEFFKVS